MSKQARVAIVGSDSFGNLDLVRDAVRGLDPGACVITRGQNEVGLTAETEAHALGLCVGSYRTSKRNRSWFIDVFEFHFEFVAASSTYSAVRSEHRIRRALVAILVQNSDRVVVFYDGSDALTRYAIKVAKRLLKPCVVFDVTGEKIDPKAVQ